MENASSIAKNNGVVGAGGAAFPAHIKLSSKAEILIVNAAECEPLLYKDEAILENFFDEFLKGVQLAKETVSAKECFIGIKRKHNDLIEEIERKLPKGFSIFPLEDAYPAGDEFLLVYDITGRVIPKGGIPLDVGVVVQNVETLYNLSLNRPVIEKFVTISGDVDEAITLRVPIGIRWGDVLKAFNIQTEGKGFIIGGPMMGFVTKDLDLPITKSDSGIVILPENHPLIYRKSRTKSNIEKIAYSCDQCMRCSDLCPRDLLGHDVKPHKAMISVSMSLKDGMPFHLSSLYCCECSLCSLYSCPEDLDPAKIMIYSKKKLFEANIKPKKAEVKVSPFYNYRRTPTSLLIRRLGLEDYLRGKRFLNEEIDAEIVIIKLIQHRGEPSIPIVRKGEKVKKGQLIARICDSGFGSNIFSSIDGKVIEVNREEIIIKR